MEAFRENMLIIFQLLEEYFFFGEEHCFLEDFHRRANSSTLPYWLFHYDPCIESTGV